MGTTDFTVTYAFAFTRFALPIRCGRGSTFSDDGYTASRGHAAVHTVVYKSTLSGCEVKMQGFCGRTGATLLVLGV